ncbi:MAG: cupin domain-containing protein [Candidatus Gastranaerophilales bacterium]|nr:cupin domain-containing protein [Candidatus Gastranaerophilales bacterium]
MNTTFNFANESKKPENLEQNAQYSSADFGKFSQITEYIMENKDINLQCNSKLFLNKVLGLTGAEISISTIPSSENYLGTHKHKENEEIYIILSGEGYILVNDKEIKVKEGSIVRVGTENVRAIKSTSETMTYICIQVKENSLTNYTLTDAQML